MELRFRRIVARLGRRCPRTADAITHLTTRPLCRLRGHLLVPRLAFCWRCEKGWDRWEEVTW